MSKRLFVDMDGTVARFHDEISYLERMFEKGFFENLKPFERAIYGLENFHFLHPDVEIFVISSTVDGYPPYCKAEKNRWLDKWLPFIDKEHRLYPKIGQNKVELVPGKFTNEDFLYDDYNKNLEEWELSGGHSIKCHNNINHKGKVGKKWTGDIIANCDSSYKHLWEDPKMSEARETYNDIMYALGKPQHSIGCNTSEAYTSEWNLRDMLSECACMLSDYYEEGGCNYPLQFSDNEEERETWKRESNMLKEFIEENEKLAAEMICVTDHKSNYDNARQGYIDFAKQLACQMGLEKAHIINNEELLSIEEL